MLMAVKNQIKVSLLSIKYALLREMLNKKTFITTHRDRTTHPFHGSCQRKNGYLPQRLDRF